MQEGIYMDGLDLGRCNLHLNFYFCFYFSIFDFEIEGGRFIM